MSADLIFLAGLPAAACVAAGWVALVVFGLNRADEARFLPRPAWILLCVFSPAAAIACLAAAWAWDHRHRRRGAAIRLG